MKYSKKQIDELASWICSKEAENLFKDTYSKEEVEELIKKYALEEHIITPYSANLNIWIKQNL